MLRLILSIDENTESGSVEVRKSYDSGEGSRVTTDKSDLSGSAVEEFSLEVYGALIEDVSKTLMDAARSIQLKEN